MLIRYSWAGRRNENAPFSYGNSLILSLIPMRSFFLTLIMLAAFSVNKLYSQSPVEDIRYTLTGELIGRDAGTVILWYDDLNNKGVRDTVKLNKGRFHFSGTVNRNANISQVLKILELSDVHFRIEGRKIILLPG